MSDAKQDPTSYLIRWAGWIILFLIFSVTAYCTAEPLLMSGDRCTLDVWNITAKCYAQSTDDDYNKDCTEQAKRMIQACQNVSENNP